ncbi:MAG: HEAT repeat domain-containing protein [Cyanobacteria bacterium]|nr:HEAT repeat domain-containing protein [Cyanobacteriota bacterium]
MELRTHLGKNRAAHAVFGTRLGDGFRHVAPEKGASQTHPSDRPALKPENSYAPGLPNGGTSSAYKPLGYYGIKFSANGPDDSPVAEPPTGTPEVPAPPAALSGEELKKINEDLNDLNTSVRLNALKKLYEQPEITDPQILLSLGRYLFYNDAYQPVSSERVQARLWTLKLLEKNKAIWAVEGLYNNIRELGNRNIGSYAGTILGRIFPTLPDWMKERFRARLLDWAISTNSSGAPDISAKVLGEVGTSKDANYVWYLMDMPGMVSEETSYDYMGMGSSSDSGTIRKRLSNILATILSKESDYKDFQEVANQYVNFSKGDVDERESRTLRQSLRLMTSFLAVFPDVALRTKYENNQQREEVLNTLLKVYSQLKEVDGITDPTQKRYAIAMRTLALDMGNPANKGFVEKLMKQIMATPKDRELVTSLYEILLEGEFNRSEVSEDFVRKKYYSASDEEWTNSLKTKIKTILDIPPDSPTLVQSYLPLLQEPNAIFRASTYIRRPEDKTIESSSYRFNPQDFEGMVTTESLFGLKLEEPQVKNWAPKFTPAQEPPTNWSLEPFGTINANREVAFYETMTAQFKEAVESDVRSDIQDVLFRTMQVWLNDKSKAAFDVLKENLGNATVFDQFQTILWRLDDTKLKKIPPKQFLDLIRSTASKGGLATYNHGETYRALMMWQAKVNPELRGELLVTALEMLKGTPENSPANEMAAKTVFNLLKFGIPGFALEKHGDTLNRMLDQLNGVFKMDTTNIRRDIDWAFFSNTTWESNSSDDGINMDQKKNFDLMIQLALKLKNKGAIEEGIRGLGSYYQRVRTNSYADEMFTIRFLRDPKIAEIILNTTDEPTFQIYREMVAWYKIFEVVPAMIQKAAQGPLRVTSWIMGTLTALDYYAVPELEKIIETSANGREKSLAREALAQIKEPKRPSELFKPFPYPLPEIYKQILGKSLNKNSTPAGDTNGNTMPNSPRISTQIEFPGLGTLTGAPQRPETTGPVDPTLSPNTGEEDAMQVRFPGLVLDPDSANRDNRPLSYLELMDQALSKSRNMGESPEARAQALQDLAFFSKQFLEVSASRDSNIPFVTPEKTELVRRISLQLVNATSDVEKTALLSSLSSLQDRICLGPLSEFLRTERSQNLREQAIGVLSQLGRAESRTPLRALLMDPEESLSLKEKALAGLIKLDDREALAVFAQETYDAGQLATDGTPGLSNGQLIPNILRQLALQGLGELRVDTPEVRQLLLNTLNSADIGLKVAALNALGQVADSNDTEVINRLVQVSQDASPLVRLAAVNACEFLDYTDSVREMMNRLRQDNDYEVSRAAGQFLTRRANR